MLIDPGHHLGDAWFAVDGPVVHAFYLRCPVDVPRHTAWEIARATSVDLQQWERHGAVVVAAPGEPCLATGSVVRDGDGWLMAFTIGWAALRPRIGLARSADLVAWERIGDGPVLPDDAAWAHDRAWGGRPVTHWRDPHLRRRADGTLEALLCAGRADVADDRSGCVAVATQQPDGSWTVERPLDVEPVARELECPQVVAVDGGWFLVFSTWPPLFADHVRSAGGERLRPGAYAMVGDGPDGPFRLTHPEPIVPADHPQQPYAGQVVALGGRAHLIGTLWRDDGPDAISDPVALRRDGDRLAVER